MRSEILFKNCVSSILTPSGTSVALPAHSDRLRHFATSSSSLAKGGYIIDIDKLQTGVLAYHGVPPLDLPQRFANDCVFPLLVHLVLQRKRGTARQHTAWIHLSTNDIGFYSDQLRNLSIRLIMCG